MVYGVLPCHRHPDWRTRTSYLLTVEFGEQVASQLHHITITLFTCSSSLVSPDIRYKSCQMSQFVSSTSEPPFPKEGITLELLSG